MIKYFLLGMPLLVSSSLFAEASMNTDEATQTFLLTAPGTLSGQTKSSKHQSANNKKITDDVKPVYSPPLRYKPRRYNHRDGGSYKFPQYGQVTGKNNPWSQQEPNLRKPKRPLMPVTRMQQSLHNFR